MNMEDDVRRKFLAQFIRMKRDSISPSACSIKVDSRRRVVGLRREEVVNLAAVGLTWYTWLEQGRDIKVSSDVLERITKALQMNQNERKYVFSLANKDVNAVGGNIEAGQDSLLKLRDILESINHPAYARNECFDVLDWNKVNTDVFGDFSKIDPKRRNIIKLMFTVGYYKKNMLRWHDDARSLVAKFRLSMAEATETTKFEEIVSELTETTPDFRDIWDRHEVSCSGEGATMLSLNGDENYTFKHYTLLPEETVNAKIVFFKPIT
jgi:PAS domain-containing protein